MDWGAKHLAICGFTSTETFVVFAAVSFVTIALTCAVLLRRIGNYNNKRARARLARQVTLLKQHPEAIKRNSALLYTLCDDEFWDSNLSEVSLEAEVVRELDDEGVASLSDATHDPSDVCEADADEPDTPNCVADVDEASLQEPRVVSAVTIGEEKDDEGLLVVLHTK